MVLLTDGHKFRYELENICRAFYPYTKLTVNESLNADAYCEDYIKAAVLPLDGGRLWVKCVIDKRTIERQATLSSDADSHEAELALCRLLYYALSEQTGKSLAWGILTGVRPSKLMRMKLEQMSPQEALTYFEEELLVSRPKALLALEVAQKEAAAIALSQSRDFSLYVSIPFCPTRCSYCSFVSHSIADAAKLIPQYVELLCRELEYTAELADSLGLRLSTVYYGGGTPTSLSAEQLQKISSSLSQSFDLSFCREYTVEAGRPDTINLDKLQVLKAAGVNRISINPQTFNDSVLEVIGRRHTGEDAVRAYLQARQAGFDNINMDLIAGLPSDTSQSFMSTVEKTVKLCPESVTVHTLALKRSSRLVSEDGLNSSTGDTHAMLEYASRGLNASGYKPYYMYRQSRCVGNLENVGYAKAGRECLYNIYMMEEIHTVLAVGAGAVTKLRNPQKYEIKRIFNYKYPYEYISRFQNICDRKNEIINFYESL